MKSNSDEQFRAYFLGKLSEPEAEAFEIEFAFDSELSEQSQLIERELVDDYLRENLSPADLRLFEKNYLITEARRHKLRTAEGLWLIAKEPAPPLRPVVEAVPKPSVRESFFGRRKAFQLAFGGLALLLAFGAIGVYWLTLSINKAEVAEVKEPHQIPKQENPPIQPPEDQPIQSPRTETQNPPSQNPKSMPANSAVQDKEAEKPLNSASKNLPEIKTAVTPKIVKQNSAGFAAFLLFAESVRSGGTEKSITIPPGVKTVNLLLNPAPGADNYKIYRVILRTAEDETIFSAANLKALSLRISAEKLENRTYVIALEGQNAKKEYESVADYTFRVRR